MWILPDVSVKTSITRPKAASTFLRSQGDTDENLNTAYFTVSLSSAPSSDNVTITMATMTNGVITLSVTGVTDNLFFGFIFTFTAELELGADGDGDRCGGQLIRRRPELRDCADRRQSNFGSSLCECGSCGCFGAKPRLHDQRRLLRFSDLRGYR